MEQIVRVRRLLDNGNAEVVHVRESACSGDCHKCGGCGAAKEAVIFTARNAIHARPGELVRVESSTAPVLKAAAVLYVLPLILFFLGYYLGTLPGSYGALGGCLGFLLGMAIVIAYDRLVARKANLTYTITAYAENMPNFTGKEEDTHG